jgi:hypothetical protein
MAARHCQWRCVNASVSLARMCKDATGSGVFQKFFYNLELHALLTGSDASGKNTTRPGVFQFFFLRKKLKSKKKKERHHCQ